MADFNGLREKYAGYLVGKGEGVYVVRTDEKTKKHILTIEKNIADLPRIKTEKRKEAIEGLHYSASVYAVFEQIRDMSLSFSMKNSAYFQNEKLLNLMLKSLNRMLAFYSANHAPYGNWWYWEIGVPLCLNTIIPLLFEKLSAACISEYMRAEVFYNSQIHRTGANRVWESVIFILRGVVTSDAQAVRAGVSGVSDVMHYADEGDGFYEDGSFIQHEVFPYNGGYGRSLLQELAPVLYLIHQTKFDTLDTKIVYDWIDNAFFPFLTDGKCMGMVRGREISRYYEQCDYAGATVLSAMLVLSELRNDRNLKERIKAHITPAFFTYAPPMASDTAAKLLQTPSDYEETPYFKAFNRMDRAVKHGKNYAIGIAMHSSRIANFESINDENMPSCHTADGMVYLYKKHAPESDFFWQTIDMQRLPGTTVARGFEVPRRSVSDCDFVGGCGIGEAGVCAMQLHPAKCTLTANKAWFFFDEEVVCLGSGICSTDGRNVETVIDNRLIGSENTKISDSDEKCINDAYFNKCQNIGYFFPRQNNVHVMTKSRQGKWSDLSCNTDGVLYTGQYNTIWIDHGQNPKEESYAYTVVPDCSAEEFRDYCAANKTETLENSARVQCVRKGGCIGAAFLTNGSASAGGIAVSDKCIAMLKTDESNLNFVLCDPTQKQKQIEVELAYSAEKAVFCDDRINILQLAPHIRLNVDVENAKGKEIRVVFKRLC